MELTRIARVAIAHNPVTAADDPSTADVLAQVELVSGALAELGLSAVPLPVPADRVLQTFCRAFEPGTLIFNLMEAPPGSPHHYLRTTAALELTGLPFTGSNAAVMWMTTDKLATRALLAAAGLPVAAGGRLDPAAPELLDRVPPPWIIKPAWEDASVGLEGDPVCATREAALVRAAALARRFPGQPVLAERFLPGREFNVSLLAPDDGAAGPEVLPVAEIVYEGFPAGMSRVLGYEAKWQEDSFACRHTVRRFPDPEAEAPLLAKLRRLAMAAWRTCGLAGYARVDLRLDETGEPHILEINANPCLAADAGFIAAAAAAGLPPSAVVRRILEAVPAAPVPAALLIRRRLEPADRPVLEEMIRATGFFNADEEAVALELVDDRLRDGDASHYRFLVGELDGQVAGYACWGPIPGTRSSVDLYWIVVHPRHQGRGVGRALLAAAEEWVAGSGRDRIYVETSTRPRYAPTRAFYCACGYELAVELPDFYAPGDGKAMFLKVLADGLRPSPGIP